MWIARASRVVMMDQLLQRTSRKQEVRSGSEESAHHARGLETFRIHSEVSMRVDTLMPTGCSKRIEMKLRST